MIFCNQKSHLVITLCVLLVCAAVFGQTAPRGRQIIGTVRDASPNLSQECFDRFAASESEEAAMQILHEIMGGRPASNVVVIARCRGTKQEVISDWEGKFKFSGLPQGIYEVSAETRADPFGKVVGRRLSTKKPLRLVENNGIVTLHLYPELIAVKGRISDIQGRPVAGARVAGTPVPVREVGLIEEVATVSGADGSYTLHGFAPLDVYRLAGYLNGGSLSTPGSLYTCVEVRVVADGFVQNKTNVPTVPLVSDELLDAARRLGKSLNNFTNQLKSKKEWREKDGVFLPVTHGNTIVNVDIVLDPASATNGE